MAGTAESCISQWDLHFLSPWESAAHKPSISLKSLVPCFPRETSCPLVPVTGEALETKALTAANVISVPLASNHVPRAV